MTDASASAIPVKAGLLGGDLNDLASVHLMGSRCAACGEVSLGARDFCANCGSDRVSPLPLGPDGTLWSYTIVRHRPPGDYRGPDPFQPFGVGLVELPQGIRVYSTIAGPVDALEIGQALRFAPVRHKDGEGRDVVAFTFARKTEGDAE